MKIVLHLLSQVCHNIVDTSEIQHAYEDIDEDGRIYEEEDEDGLTYRDFFTGHPPGMKIRRDLAEFVSCSVIAKYTLPLGKKSQITGSDDMIRSDDIG